MTKRSKQWLAMLSISLGVLISVPVLADCGDAPKPQVDWTKCTKMRLVLTDSDLSGAKLERTNLSSTDLAGAKLRDAMLFEAVVDRARFQNVDLTGSDLTKLQGSRADFQNANFTGATLTKSELLRADFSGANLENVDLSKSELGRAVFSDAALNGANLSYANISRANFSDAQLENADLTRAYMFLTRLEGVDLSTTKGLSQDQLDLACGDGNTELPDGLVTPESWPCPADN